jgi:vacuolar iron transporter family protein
VPGVGAPHLWVTLALTAVGLTALGAAVGRLTGRPVQRSGLRRLTQLALGALAFAVTYGVGHLIGAASPGPAPASVRALAGVAAAVRRM